MKSFPLVPLVVAALAVGLSAPQAAGAQLKTGNLYGTAVDNQGSPLPGVTVTLRGAGSPMVQVTNAQGQFRFLNLPEGTNGMKAELEGFSTVDYPNVGIRQGRNTEIEVTLSPAVEEVITVTSESPLLDERRISTGGTVSETELEKIPTARDPWEIARLTPPLNVPDDVAPPGVDPMEAFAKVLAGQDVVEGVRIGYGPPPGGLPTGDKPAWVATPRDPWAILQQTPGVLTDRINVGGNEAGRQSTWSVDGVVITDMAAQGSSPGTFDFESFEEMQLSTGGSDASIATGGVVLNMVTKRGTNEWRGSGRYFISDEDWDAAGERVRDYVDAALEFGGEIGGPIVKDRLWIWGSYGSQEVDLLDLRDAMPEGTPSDAGSQSPFHGYLQDLYGAGYTRGCDIPGFNVFTTPGTDCGPIGIQLQNLYGTGAFQGFLPDPFATRFRIVPTTIPPVTNEPLYIVNGQRVETTTGIGPEEIENIEVLKGSAATALYGSMGANGVVLITTKPGADPGGRSMIAVDPGDPSGNTVYATGTAGETWKTTDFLTTNPDGPTWTKLTGAGDPTAFQIEDTEVFSSDFYLTGLYSVVNGGFQLVPQSGSGPVMDFRSTPGSFDSDFSIGFSSGSGQPSQANPSGALVSSPPDFRLGSRMFDSTRSPRDGLFVTVFDRSDFTQCPNGVLGGFRPGAPVDLGNGSTFTPFTSLPVDCDSFEWDTIVPRIGLTYALGKERRTLLRASYSRFADQLGAGSSEPSPGSWFFDSYRADELPSQQGDVVVEQPAAEEKVFLQDRVRMGDYFSLNLGVRYDEDEASPPPVLDPGIFNPTYLSGFPTLPLDQSFGGRFRFSYTPGLDQQGPGGSSRAGGAEPGGADGAEAAPTVLLVSLGQSTGQAFRALVVGDAPATIEGVAVLEPVAASAADVAELERSMSQAGAQTVEVEAYCFEFDGRVPAAGTAYRFAPPEAQQAFEPLARVLRAAERVREAGGLVPDTALDTYAPAISQWAVWAKEKGFDLESFGEAWLEHVKKNVAQAGEEFTADLEQAVRERVPGRWRDIEKILAEADR